MALPNDTRMPGKLEVLAVEARLSLGVREIVWLVEQSDGCDGAWGSTAVSGGEGVILGPADCCGGSENPEYRSRCLDGKNWVCDIMAKGANQMLKDCRENEGKMAWLFIEVLSRADRRDDVIADDELAGLII